MIVAVADTHAAIWYLSNDPRLSSRAGDFMDDVDTHGEHIGISSISLIEMVYLIEKGRIPPERFTQLAILLSDRNSMFIETPVDLRIGRALSRVDVMKVPDMPDRIVAATAMSLNVPVISRDSKIQVSGIQTIW